MTKKIIAYRYWLWVGLLVLIVFSIIPLLNPMASAQNNNIGLTISPSILEINPAPGTTATVPFTITNDSDSIIPFTILPKTLIPLDPEIDPSKRGDFDASRWIKLSKDSVILEPGQSTEVLVSLTPPETVLPGGHYAQITVQPLYLESGTNQNVTTIPELNITVFSTPQKGSRGELNVRLGDMKPVLTRQSPQSARIFISNSGDTHELIKPILLVKKSDETIGSVELTAQIVLPNTVREIEVPWVSPLKLGSYTLVAQVRPSTQTDTDTSTEKTFWVSPHPASIIYSILGIFITIYMLKKRQNIQPALQALRKNSTKKAS